MASESGNTLCRQVVLGAGAISIKQAFAVLGLHPAYSPAYSRLGEFPLKTRPLPCPAGLILVVARHLPATLMLPFINRVMEKIR